MISVECAHPGFAGGDRGFAFEVGMTAAIFYAKTKMGLERDGGVNHIVKTPRSRDVRFK
jgi:hypothetical protein